MYEHHHRHFFIAFRKNESAGQLYATVLEGGVAHIEGDALSRLPSKENLAFTAIGERHGPRVGAPSPAVGTRPRTVLLTVELAGFAAKRPPAQRAIVGRRDIYRLAVT
ncbi:MAG TPA: hypothetical protein VFE36_02480 [Candidatus Baltobacteraceae bacterium]|nr:hypothetical protein [Candidatus Baltobacteraceae bacterium]